MLDYTTSFTCAKRANATYFYSIKDDPINADLVTLLREIHLSLFYDSFPDDWIYAETYYAFEALAQCDTPDDYDRHVSSIEGDPYAHDLYEWAKSGYAQQYIDGTFEDYRRDRIKSPESIFTLIQIAQINAKTNIYEMVWEFLNCPPEPFDHKIKREDMDTFCQLLECENEILKGANESKMRLIKYMEKEKANGNDPTSN